MSRPLPLLVPNYFKSSLSFLQSCTNICYSSPKYIFEKEENKVIKFPKSSLNVYLFGYLFIYLLHQSNSNPVPSLVIINPVRHFCKAVFFFHKIYKHLLLIPKIYFRKRKENNNNISQKTSQCLFVCLSIYLFVTSIQFQPRPIPHYYKSSLSFLRSC